MKVDLNFDSFPAEHQLILLGIQKQLDVIIHQCVSKYKYPNVQRY